MMRVVVGYSGGLETAAAVPWLAETYGAEVVALTLDVGQGGALEAVRDGALESGALRAHVLDVREEFAQRYVLPALRADALDERGCPMAEALTRPLIASKLVEVARLEGASAIVHGESGANAGGLHAAARALDPSIRVLAPARDWPMSRQETRAYAQARGIAVRPAEEPYHADANLWGRSILAVDGSGDEAWPPPPLLYTRTRAVETCPDEPALVEIAFEHGTPTTINGVAMPLVEFIATLDAIAGDAGVGRIAPSAREVREAPAALVLHEAHEALRTRFTPRALDARCRQTSAAYARLIREGRWFTPTRDDLDRFEQSVQERLTGLVRLQLCRGDCRLMAVD
jgi:argininosuccinate synthase